MIEHDAVVAMAGDNRVDDWVLPLVALAAVSAAKTPEVPMAGIDHPPQLPRLDVVFTKVGTTFEIAMVELGRGDGDFGEICADRAHFCTDRHRSL